MYDQPAGNRASSPGGGGGGETGRARERQTERERERKRELGESDLEVNTRLQGMNCGHRHELSSVKSTLEVNSLCGKPLTCIKSFSRQ